jgi:hypothetical protein
MSARWRPGGVPAGPVRLLIAIEHAAHRVFHAVLGVAYRVADAGGERVGQQNRRDTRGADQDRQPRPARLAWPGSRPAA